MGETISEQLDIINTAFKVIETIRPKLACSRCDVIVQAPLPPKPIERGYASAGLLARILVSKYMEHIPLYRLKWHTEFGHLNRGDMLTSEQHRCSNEKKKF